MPIFSNQIALEEVHKQGDLLNDTCDIYFHFPFDIGFNIGDGGFERAYGIIKALFEKCDRDFITIDLVERIEIATPKFMRDYSKRRFFINEKTRRLT